MQDKERQASESAADCTCDGSRAWDDAAGACVVCPAGEGTSFPSGCEPCAPGTAAAAEDAVCQNCQEIQEYAEGFGNVFANVPLSADRPWCEFEILNWGGGRLGVSEDGDDGAPVDVPDDGDGVAGWSDVKGWSVGEGGVRRKGKMVRKLKELQLEAGDTIIVPD